MHGFRILLALIAPPMLYGLLCLPLTQWALGLFPGAVTDEGAVFEISATLAIEGIQCLTLLICGVTIAAIMPIKASRVLILGLATALMLAIAVVVQWQYWHDMLIWHHFVFFTMILAFQPLGAIGFWRFSAKRVKGGATSAAP